MESTEIRRGRSDTRQPSRCGHDTKTLRSKNRRRCPVADGKARGSLSCACDVEFNVSFTYPAYVVNLNNCFSFFYIHISLNDAQIAHHHGNREAGRPFVLIRCAHRTANLPGSSASSSSVSQASAQSTHN